jgi:hypothetical protein
VSEQQFAQVHIHNISMTDMLNVGMMKQCKWRFKKRAALLRQKVFFKVGTRV